MSSYTIRIELHERARTPYPSGQHENKHLSKLQQACHIEIQFTHDIKWTQILPNVL